MSMQLLYVYCVRVRAFTPHDDPERYVGGFISSLLTEETEAHGLMTVLVAHRASKSWLLLEYTDLRPTGDDMKGLYIFVLWLSFVCFTCL